jgi:hypothetical protein
VVLRKVFEGLELDTKLLIFRDLAYKGAFGVLGAYVQQPQKPLTADQQWFNVTMSTVRISIEQLFG